MTVRFRVSGAAQDDLLEIWNYVFQLAESDQRADSVVDALFRTFSTLAENPGLGTPRARLPGGRLAFPKDGYLIVYVVLPGGIELTRVSGGDGDIGRG